MPVGVKGATSRDLNQLAATLNDGVFDVRKINTLQLAAPRSVSYDHFKLVEVNADQLSSNCHDGIVSIVLGQPRFNGTRSLRGHDDFRVVLHSEANGPWVSRLG